jgi:rare lipoprotein A
MLPKSRIRISLSMSLLLASLGMYGCTSQDAVTVVPAAAPSIAPVKPARPARPAIDRSGDLRVGVASFYATSFAGREMADGARMDPSGDNAASRTLPLGTKAKVTNMATGKSAIIIIEDRGPYAKGRIIDLSPSTARRIGITPRLGIARVAVAPIAVPLADGSLKPGVAAQDRM